MRNSTKLKIVLEKYSMALDLEKGGLFKLTLVDKVSDATATFEGKSYSEVLRLAHSFMLKEGKKK